MLKASSKTFPVKTGEKCVSFLEGTTTVLTLEEQLGADGAEGRVFRCTTKSGKAYAVKIYHSEYRVPRSEQLLRKLHFLTLAQAEFVKFRDPCFAWPLATVHLGKKPPDIIASNFIGFVMPLAGRLHEFYDLIKRFRTSGTPTLTQRIAMAFFLARGFAALHAVTAVATPEGPRRVTFTVGDVNDSNIRVTDSNTIFFFDCDSYIVRAGSDDFGQWTTTIDYSSPEFLAKGQTEKYIRTSQDDNFGLAVLIFRLLNNWELPYRYHGATVKSRTALILDRRFPYASNSQDHVIPGAERTLAEYRSSMHPIVSQLFERAFLPNRARPNAAEWVSALQTFLLSRSDVPKRRSPNTIENDGARIPSGHSNLSYWTRTPSTLTAYPIHPPSKSSKGSWRVWLIAAVIVGILILIRSRS